MRQIQLIILILVITSCSFNVSEDTLKSMAGNKYLSGGGFVGEVITLDKDSTFDVYFHSCTYQATEFTGIWYLESDTLVLYRENSNRFASLDTSDYSIEYKISNNLFETLMFKVKNHGISMVEIDGISTIDKDFFYRNSR